MSLIVQKFGGSSVADLDRIRNVANIVTRTKAQGHQIVVVVSAMQGETDRLVGLAKSVNGTPMGREYAMMVSTGEQVSMALLAMVLNDKGYKACSMTGSQAGIQTDSQYKKARILAIDINNIQAVLARDQIVVVAGFQGVNEEGDITTLGRGGSDTSAVALAAALKADECQIYTDVEGVYTSDPRVVPEARKLDYITFEEMLELSSLGAKVLQIRAVEFAGKYNVPVRVLSSFKTGSGTLITYEGHQVENPIVSGVAFNRTEAKITVLNVPDEPGLAASILGPVSDAGIEIDMIVQNAGEDKKTNFTFTVHKDDYKQTLALLDHLTKEHKGIKIIGDNKIGKLSIVGVGMRSHAGIAMTVFETLAKEGINIQLISTSEIKISVIVEEKYVELGIRALHSAFSLDVAPEEEFHASHT